jgi:hypothetical protein
VPVENFQKCRGTLRLSRVSGRFGIVENRQASAEG